MSNLKKFFAKELAEELEAQRVTLTKEFGAAYTALKKEYEEYKLAHGKKQDTIYFHPDRQTFTLKMEVTEDLLLGTHEPEKVLEHACAQMYHDALNTLKNRYPHSFRGYK